MALGDVPVSGVLTPTDRVLDTYAITEDTFQKRGFRVVATTVEMNAITAERRGQGMWVLNLQDGLLYELQANLTTWTPRAMGGTGTVVTGVDVTGTLPTLTLIPSGITAASYGTASNVPQIIFDAKGRATSAVNVPIIIGQAAVTGLTASLALKENKSEKGVANGYVPLNSSNMIDPSYYISGTGLIPMGNWNATTNTPSISDAGGSLGEWYVCTVAGSQNLGSGVIAFSVDDWVIHDGTKFVRNGSGVPATTGITTINTDSGALTGATVALNITSQIAPTADRQYQTALQKSIQDAAVTAGATLLNRYALLSEVNTPITVTNEWNTPERYGDGTNTVGTSISSRLLNTLINPATGVNYTNVSAAARWNLVTGIDVTTWEYDEACVDQAFRGMELASGSAMIQFHDNRVYMYRQSHNMPSISQWSSTYKPDSWVFKGNGSRHFNRSGAARTLWKHTPADQTAAVLSANPYTSYKILMENISFFGANLGVINSGDCCLEISATYGGCLNNVVCSSADIGLRMFFCLSTQVKGGNFGFNSRSGILVATGAGYGGGPIWSGASLGNSASNLVNINPSNFNMPNNAFAGFEGYGSNQITVGGDLGMAFEGGTGTSPTHHVYFDAQSSTLVKGFFVKNIHLEQSVDTSHICVTNSGQVVTAYMEKVIPFLGTANPSIFEARSTGGIVIMVLSNCPSNDQNWKYRNVGTGSECRWFQDMVYSSDQNNPYSATNWDLTTKGGLTGSIPPSPYANVERISPIV